MLAMSRVKRARWPLADTSMLSPMFEPLNSSLSVPAWPSTTSLPSPGSHVNVSSPAPIKATSLPCWPSMVSSPSPPFRLSTPLLPRSVSLPAPPSMVSLMRAARLPVAEKRSSPPLAFSTRCSTVPMSRKKGAGVRRSKRTRAPLAVAVKVSAPLPPLTSTVSTPSPPSTTSLSSPGFQISRSLPGPPKIVSLPAPPIDGVVAAAAIDRVVAGATLELVGAGAAGEGVVAGAADEVGLWQRAVGLVERRVGRCRPDRGRG